MFASMIIVWGGGSRVALFHKAVFYYLDVTVIWNHIESVTHLCVAKTCRLKLLADIMFRCLFVGHA